LPLLRILRNFVAKTNEIHSIMKNLYIKTVQICALFFLFTSLVWAQDFENSEQIEHLQPIEQNEQNETDMLKFYIQNAQYKQAIEFINSLEPTKDLLFQKALCCKSLNEYSSAIEILTSLSKEYPDDISVRMQLALCYEAISQYPKGIECYDYLLQLDSTNSYFEVRKADLLFRSEKYALAIEAYTQIDSTYNRNYIARCIAMCYEKLNQTEIAKDYYNYACELNANDVYSANSLVKIFVKEEDYISAYVYSERFIENDSTNLTMNALNAYIYYNLKEYDIALERFEKCLHNGDSSLIVSRSLGMIYSMAEMDSLARVFLNRAFLQDTTNNNVLYTLGKVNHKLGYYQDAIECYMKLIEKNLEQIPSPVLFYLFYNGLAMAYEQNEEFNNAVKTYIEAIRYTKDNNTKMALYYKIAILSDEKLMNYNQAISYYRKYRLSLFNYQYSLKDEQEQEINEIELKLNALDEYIKQLTEKNKAAEIK
jgi:tetratricopeptide (TPR) repeat protein